MGQLVPSFMPVSMSAALATPSANACAASLIIGNRMRLTTKPGESVTVIGVLPTASA